MTVRALALCTTLLLAGIAAADPQPLSTSLTLVRTIPLPDVEGRIDHLAADVEGKRLYVAAIARDRVEVIDLAAGQPVQSLRDIRRPTGVRVLPGSRKVVVASGGDGKVRVFAPDLKLLGTIDGLDDADNVRLDPQGKLAYVGYGEGAIAVINPEPMKKVGEIKLDGHPEAFQLEAHGNRLFVNVPTAKQVAVIDRTTQRVLATWPVREAAANFPMALDEANGRLFVGCREPATVLVLDTQSGAAVASIPCCGDADDLFYDATSKRLLVSGGDGSITLIAQEEADHYRSLGTTPTATGARTSLFVPETRLLYVAVPHRGAQPAELRVFQVLP